MSSVRDRILRDVTSFGDRPVVSPIGDGAPPIPLQAPVVADTVTWFAFGHR